MKAYISTYSFADGIPHVTKRDAGDGKTNVEIRPGGATGEHYIVFDRAATTVIRDRLNEILGVAS